MMLYHYFDSKIGPFRNLSDLTDEEADRVILQFRQQKKDSVRLLRQDIMQCLEWNCIG